MKIAILSPAHPFRGGIAASSERLAREFFEMGYEVELITFTRQYPAFLFPGKTQYSDSPRPEGLKITRMIHAYNPFNWLMTGLKLKKHPADLFIVRYWIPHMAPALGTIMALAKGNRRCIALVDNIIPHEPHFYDACLSAYFIRQMDGFVVMSKSVGEEIRRFQQVKPVSYRPHPIYDIYGAKRTREQALAALRLDPSFSYLLFFGFVRDYKGLDLLLEAMAVPEIREMPLKLIVAGEFYGGQEKYTALIERLELEDKVILHSDFIPDDTVKDYFSAADLLVQPYRSATQSGIAQIAYHFELPMIVTNVGGLPEIVKDGESGFVVEPDPTSIAGAILQFFKENKAETFIRGTAEWKKHFSWRNLANSFLEGIS